MNSRGSDMGKFGRRRGEERNNVNTVYVCIKKLKEFNRDMF